ncbi:hypothetical protein DOK78_001788 [Enterococcus sp. DIV2402]|uniref:Uncharacterized protein n=1 Tax=Candidatus Enterococcus lowellii TaxID=2230877 RepID=A0ABZ2SQ68_9ENTE|nr:hypothetical protein [Enterococcus sp. DIV2402]MBO0464031.1 hypothetical protein [Enterococcus sp. DIV2402]
MSNTIYQITTNPRQESQLLVNPKLFEDEKGRVAAVAIPINCIQTGMYHHLEDIKYFMLKAAFIFTLGNLDETSYFELGIASALKKKIYVVSKNKKLSATDLKLYMSDIDIKFISPDAFIELLNTIE